MKVVAVVGSYRAGGMTDQAVAAIVAGAVAEGAEVETIRLADQDITFCRNCRACTQAPGDELGACPLDDAMPGLIRTCAAADVLVLAAPVNMGTTTAVTKRFIERLAPTAEWPWDRPAPRPRRWIEPGRIAAVLVSSSAAPSLLARLAGFRGLADLRWIARAFGARVVATRWYGLAGGSPVPTLSPRQARVAESLGRRVIRDQGRRHAG
jgi:NAD(P)H-dependent FMN reductase